MTASFSRLLRGAARLNAQSRNRRLPPLLFVTDPARIGDPLSVLRALPKGANGRLGVIFRHFGAPDRLKTAQALAKLCRKRRFLVLIGADVPLAARIRADGVHLPERMARRARQIKRRKPDSIVTLAAHSPKTLRYEGLDAFLVSPVFDTQSAGARDRNTLGRRGLSRFARATATPVYALGGINAQNIQMLRGAIGAAMASGFLPGALQNND